MIIRQSVRQFFSTLAIGRSVNITQKNKNNLYNSHIPIIAEFYSSTLIDNDYDILNVIKEKSIEYSLLHCRINIMNNPSFIYKNDIHTIPTIQYIYKGQVIDEIVGCIDINKFYNFFQKIQKKLPFQKTANLANEESQNKLSLTNLRIGQDESKNDLNRYKEILSIQSSHMNFEVPNRCVMSTLEYIILQCRDRRIQPPRDILENILYKIYSRTSLVYESLESNILYKKLISTGELLAQMPDISISIDDLIEELKQARIEECENIKIIKNESYLRKCRLKVLYNNIKSGGSRLISEYEPILNNIYKKDDNIIYSYKKEIEYYNIIYNISKGYDDINKYYIKNNKNNDLSSILGMLGTPSPIPIPKLIKYKNNKKNTYFNEINEPFWEKWNRRNKEGDYIIRKEDYNHKYAYLLDNDNISRILRMICILYWRNNNFEKSFDYAIYLFRRCIDMHDIRKYNIDNRSQFVARRLIGNLFTIIKPDDPISINAISKLSYSYTNDIWHKFRYKNCTARILCGGPIVRNRKWIRGEANVTRRNTNTWKNGYR
eukprot:GHVL01027289.1.p1 GENE.GHVL01027289.1~~GHVL01027289.1.p1  ORF type:complete len:546 (+),score=162.02 GHVL01027289.1:24-1661(+)